jgi:protein-L-isoaspartate(D-aspartate) O-methyltransferase
MLAAGCRKNICTLPSEERHLLRIPNKTMGCAYVSFTKAGRRSTQGLGMTTEDLQRIRTLFAKEIQQQGRIKSAALIEGLATVPRENFVGPGPWKIMRAGVYQLTPDDNPQHLYDNVLVALDERRLLNNGEPLALLLFLDSLKLSAGDRFLHIGCGVGYYTAIAAHAVAPHGTTVGVEIDPALAARAKLNLQSYATVTVVTNNGALDQFGTFDAIFVNAGCTRPQALWLDQLAVGGRLLVPLTVEIPTMPGIGAGSILLVSRGETEYSAKFASSVGIFHCEGARSEEEEALLAKAFASGNPQSVCRLRLDAHQSGPNCWLHASGFCLESDPALRQGPRVVVHIDSTTLARYVGRYQLAPAVVLTLTQRDGGLFAQSPGGNEVPIYPESETQFFYGAVDAQITFVTDGTGRAFGLVLRHGGSEVPAQRID